MGALTPRAISAMEPGLIRLVDSLLDEGDPCIWVGVTPLLVK
jgi:hypothetical protein